MVARLFKLRLALLLSAFRGHPSRVARKVAAGALAVFGAVVLALIPQWIARSAAEHAGSDTVLTAVVLFVALIVPFFANRTHLEPRQFAQYSAGSGSVATGLWISTLLSWPTLWLAAWLLSLLVVRAEWRVAWWAVALGLLLILLLAITSARVGSGLAKLLIAPRRAGAVRAIGILLLVAALPVVVFVVTQALSAPGGTMAEDASRVLGWTPLGAPMAGITLAVGGDAGGALLRFGVAAASLAVLLGLWFPIVRRSLESVARPADPGSARQGLGWFERFPARPDSAIAARVITYWVRDPRYRVALAAVPIAPVLMLVALWVAGVDAQVLALIPLPVILLLLGWSVHNDVSMDSTAVWTHVASGTRGRDDRLGRLAPVLLLGLPLALVGSSVTVTLMGDWRVLPAVIGLNLAVLLVACGSASVFSALMPYPTTRPGDSPFAQPAVSGSGSGLAQSLSMGLAIAFSLPPVWIAATAIGSVSFGMNFFALIFGAGYGLVAVTVGVLVGGRIFDRSAPELLALTQTFD